MKTILGIFANRSDAEGALTQLESKGYEARDISIITREGSKTVDPHVSAADNVAGGAVSGATTGGVIGGIAGLLIGIGAIAIPGIGGFLIGGPLAAALGLTGAAATTVSGAATGALAGGLVGALTGLGVPEETAQVYEERLREGAVLLAVSTNKTNDEVRQIFQEHSADQIQTIMN